MELNLTCVFDQDGNMGTTGDQILKTITINPKGSGNGIFNRNGYYRIHGTITDFDTIVLNSEIEVKDWETPETEDYGNITIG